MAEHIPIITNELFDLVQFIFAKNRFDNALGNKNHNPNLLI